MSTVVIFDLETSGLQMDKHAIIQIAALAVDFRTLVVLDEYERKVQFQLAQADLEALEKNCFDKEIWRKEAVPPLQVCEEFSGFLRSHAALEMTSKRTGKPYRVAELCGHNSDRFDMPFLMTWFKRLGKFMPAYPAALDTCQLSRWHFKHHPVATPPSDFRLETLCRYFGIEGEWHDARDDARGVLELIRCLRGEK